MKKTLSYIFGLYSAAKDQTNSVVSGEGESKIDFTNYGKVKTTYDGIAKVHGLNKVQYGEQVIFASWEDKKLVVSHVRGVVLAVERESTVVAIFDDQRLVRQGDIVIRTSSIMPPKHRKSSIRWL